MGSNPTGGDGAECSKVTEDDSDELGFLKHHIRTAHKNAIDHGFWESVNLPEKIALMHSELSEALEVLRKGGQKAELAEELADTVIRIFDFCGFLNIDLGEAILIKMEYNASRPYKHGKSF